MSKADNIFRDELDPEDLNPRTRGGQRGPDLADPVRRCWLPAAAAGAGRLRWRGRGDAGGRTGREVPPMSTENTPALELAGALYAVAEHLVEYPHLPSVDVDGRVLSDSSIDFSLQIATYPHRGEPEDVAAVLLWAQSLDNPTITLQWNDIAKTTLAIHVEAVLGGYAVRVWTCDEGDLKRWHDQGARTRITLEHLAAYVAAGTVEHAVATS